MRPKKPVPNFAKQKSAFDQVLAAYRDSRSNVTLIGCININPSGGGGGTPDKAKPIAADFRCDVEKQVEALVASKYLHLFWAAYTFYYGDDLGQEIFAQRVLGDRRHSWEQRLGAKFIETGLFPTGTYMQHTRVA